MEESDKLIEMVLDLLHMDGGGWHLIVVCQGGAVMFLV